MQVLPVVIDPGGQVVQQVLSKGYGAMGKQLMHVVGLPEQESQGEEQSNKISPKQKRILPMHELEESRKVRGGQEFKQTSLYK